MSNDLLMANTGQLSDMKRRELLQLLKYNSEPHPAMSTIAGGMLGGVSGMATGMFGGMGLGALGKFLAKRGLLGKIAPFLAKTSPETGAMYGLGLGGALGGLTGYSRSDEMPGQNKEELQKFLSQKGYNPTIHGIFGD
jgi:hypothetical protein